MKQEQNEDSHLSLITLKCNIDSEHISILILTQQYLTRAHSDTPFVVRHECKHELVKQIGIF